MSHKEFKETWRKDESFMRYVQRKVLKKMVKQMDEELMRIVNNES